MLTLLVASGAGVEAYLVAVSAPVKYSRSIYKLSGLVVKTNMCLVNGHSLWQASVCTYIYEYVQHQNISLNVLLDHLSCVAAGKQDVTTAGHPDPYP